MGSFGMRLLITLNAFIPICCYYKGIQMIILCLSDHNIEIDLKLGMYLVSYSTRFLTNWALIIQLINMIGFFVHDVMEMIGVAKDFRSRLKSHMDKCFYHITSCTNFFVSFAYWILYIYDEELVAISIPFIGQVPVPLWLNLLMHLLNSVNILLHAWNDEKFIEHNNKYWPGVYYHLIYVSWYYLLAWIEELPVYPITDRMEEPYRLLFMLSLSFLWPLLQKIIHSIGRKIYLSRNAKDYREKEKEK